MNEFGDGNIVKFYWFCLFFIVIFKLSSYRANVLILVWCDHAAVHLFDCGACMAELERNMYARLLVVIMNISPFNGIFKNKIVKMCSRLCVHDMVGFAYSIPKKVPLPSAFISTIAENLWGQIKSIKYTLLARRLNISKSSLSDRWTFQVLDADDVSNQGHLENFTSASDH